ncbi:MAG: hypothetical protein HZB18_00295 [Chloroflexi bacterium]|nr:hypothetical protein [Chloroflexota bacterium]
MLKNFGFALLLSSMFAMLITSTIPARANDIGSVIYNTKVVTLQETKINAVGSTVGQYGYQVFNPGAIGYTTARTMTPGLINGRAKRRGSTDAWLNFVITPAKPFGSWDHFGGHQSSSDLWEGEIWVDGFLKISNDANWRASCSNHLSGNYAYCTTSFNQLIARLIKAKSNHHFHKNNYIDNNFSTADNA